MRKPTLLIFGMDDLIRQNLKGKLFRHGFGIIEASSTSNITSIFRKIEPDLVIICSAREISGDGLTEVNKIRQIESLLPIILMTKFSSESRAISALRARVNDYFKIPFSSDAVINSIKHLISEKFPSKSFATQSDTECSFKDQPFIGKSKPMKDVKSFLFKVARADSTVLITGETGTGKELAAGYIHRKSQRFNRPFICVNCAALPESLVESELFGYDRGAFTGAFAYKKGKFELASGGSVFLDEIGDMTQFAQAKILRTIESKEFFHLGGKRSIPMNARVIAATNQDPERLMAEGNFRKDLYYRLNVARVHMPPLRERREDLLHLIQHAIQKLNHRFARDVEGLTDDAMVCLLRYDWPGNVRELLNLLEAAYINLPSRKLSYIDLPKPIYKQLKMTQATSKDERKKIIATLLETNWNKSTAAQKLNWSRMTLYRKIEKYNIVQKRSSVNRF
jgi:DNA-binding NtrC family response regulator